MDLSHNYVGDKGVTALAKALPNSKIQSLSLSYNDIGDEGVTALAEALPHSKVQSLYLTSNNIGDEGALAFAHVLTKGGPKSHLSWIVGLDKNIKRALARAEPNTNLESLFLYDNHISEKGAVEMCRVLPQTYINFNSNLS